MWFRLCINEFNLNRIGMENFENNHDPKRGGIGVIIIMIVAVMAVLILVKWLIG